MNRLDKLISWINPEAGLKRERNRVAMDMLRSYEAATTSRRTSNWRATGADANAEALPALNTLRNRSRDQVRNNVYARQTVRSISANTIGTGIKPTPVDVSRAAEKRLLKAWNEWAGTRACDFDGLLNFYGIQRLAMRTVVESGECLILRRKTNDPIMPTQIQVLEPDFIDSLKNVTRTKDGGKIIQGVEFDAKGKRLGYWLYGNHPGAAEGYLINSEFHKDADVCHVYFVERPGQFRGLPWMVASMIRMKDFDDYEDAELVRQKIAACFTVFVQDNNPDATMSSTADVELASRVEPGIIEMLPPGKQVSFAQPPSTNGYESYSRKILQGIAAGTGITYEMMTGDLSNVNFSSGRMGWLEFQRNVTDWQENMLVPMLCDKVWGWFIEAAVIVGKAKPGITASWTPPRREMIDPVKETDAMSKQVRNGFITYSEAVRQLGYDPDDVMDEMQSDFTKLDEKNIILDSDPRQGKVAAVTPDTPPA